MAEQRRNIVEIEQISDLALFAAIIDQLQHRCRSPLSAIFAIFEYTSRSGLAQSKEVQSEDWNDLREALDELLKELNIAQYLTFSEGRRPATNIQGEIPNWVNTAKVASVVDTVVQALLVDQTTALNLSVTAHFSGNENNQRDTCEDSHGYSFRTRYAFLIFEFARRVCREMNLGLTLAQGKQSKRFHITLSTTHRRC